MRELDKDLNLHSPHYYRDRLRIAPWCKYSMSNGEICKVKGKSDRFFISRGRGLLLTVSGFNPASEQGVWEQFGWIARDSDWYLRSNMVRPTDNPNDPDDEYRIYARGELEFFGPPPRYTVEKFTKEILDKLGVCHKKLEETVFSSAPFPIPKELSHMIALYTLGTNPHELCFSDTGVNNDEYYAPYLITLSFLLPVKTKLTR